jgi:ATP-binding cassette subfamily C protein
VIRDKGANAVLSLLKHFFVAYPARTASVVLLLTLAGFAEGVGVVALLPFIELASSGPGNAKLGHIGHWFSGALASLGLTTSLGVLLSLIVLSIVAKAGVTLIAMREVGYAVGKLMTDLRHRLIRALMEARWSYFIGQPLGVFANAIGAETIRAGTSYQQSARFVSIIIQALVYALATVIVSWRAALFAVLAGVIGVLVFRRVIRAAHDSGGKQTELLRALSTRTTDTLQGIKPIKAMGTERFALPLLDHEVQELDEAQRQQVWSAELLRVAQEPLLVILLAAGIWGAVELGGESLPSLMVVALLFYRLFNRLQAVQEIYQQIAMGESAYWAMHDLSANAEREREQTEGISLPPERAPRIEIDNVSFFYGESRVLDGASVTIESGEFVAISGHSGGGKTTLLDMVCGLNRPGEGQVRVDGIDLAEVELAAWRRRIGYVPQDPLLLHDTVYQNVVLGDQAITRAEVESALRMAGLWDVVAALPRGIDTMVGERGGRFSGGQRQRMSLARALVRRPVLLLLDEITAALDEETERAVCATLRHLAGEMTVIAVSHQAEMARVADRVFRLHDGRFVSGRQ